MQRNGGPDLLRDALRAAKPGAVFVSGAPVQGAIEMGKEHGLLVHLPETGLHPEDVVKVIRTLVAAAVAGTDVAISTHSITVLYAINNEVAAHGFKDTAMYIADEDRHVRHHEGWIDESYLGWVTDDLSAELNQTLARRAEAPKS